MRTPSDGWDSTIKALAAQHQRDVKYAAPPESTWIGAYTATTTGGINMCAAPTNSMCFSGESLTAAMSDVAHHPV